MGVVVHRLYPKAEVLDVRPPSRRCLNVVVAAAVAGCPSSVFSIFPRVSTLRGDSKTRPELVDETDEYWSITMLHNNKALS